MNEMQSKKISAAALVVGKILQVYGINSANFARIVGKNPSYISDIKNGKTRRISEDAADKIIEKWPELSRTWVLTGEGDMLRVNNGEQKPLPIVEYAPSPKESAFEAQNTLLREQLREKEDVIAKLHSEIAVLNYKLNQEREKASSSLETTSAERL